MAYVLDIHVLPLGLTTPSRHGPAAALVPADHRSQVGGCALSIGDRYKHRVGNLIYLA